MAEFKPEASSYDRTAATLLSTLPLGSLVDLQVGSRFNVRSWSALRTHTGWIRVTTNDRGGIYSLEAEHEKLDDPLLEEALGEGRLWVKVTGPKVGQKIEHPISLDGFPEGSMVRETDQYVRRLHGERLPMTFRKKTGRWVPASPADEQERERRDLEGPVGVGNRPNLGLAWTFQGVIKAEGLVLEKL